MYDESLEERRRSEILQFCINADHNELRVSECLSCYKSYLKIGALLKQDCDKKKHEKIRYQTIENSRKEYFLCTFCHRAAIIKACCSCSQPCLENCPTMKKCDHISSRRLSSLKPLTLGLLGIKNIPDSNDEVSLRFISISISIRSYSLDY